MTNAPRIRNGARIRTAVVGCGAWGRNIVRELVGLPGVDLVAVADLAEAGRARARALAPRAAVVPTLDEALDQKVDAVILATPALLHAEQALAALAAGAHLLVEKPLATDAASAQRLKKAAAESGRIALVGHIVRYHPAVERMVELARGGELGEIQYATAARLSAYRSADPSVIWALAPHDLSIWRAVGGAPLREVEVRQLGPHVAFLTATLETGRVAQIELSRVHAFKERRFVVVGDRAVALFDDTAQLATLTLHRPPERRSTEFSTFREFLETNRRSATLVEIPHLQPLTRELDHFFSCIRGEAEPRTDFAEGAEIVAALDRALVRRTG